MMTATTATLILASVAHTIVSTHGSSVVFSTPSSTGHSSASRRDPDLLTLPSTTATSATVLATGVVNGVNTFVVSSDGGTTWHQAPADVVAAGTDYLITTTVTTKERPHRSGKGAGDAPTTTVVKGNVVGIPNKYLKDVTAGPWTSQPAKLYSVDADGTLTVTNGSADDVSHWTALPHIAALVSWMSGGVTHVKGDTYVATPWVWYHNTTFVEPSGKLNITCCNGSVVAYTTQDAGKTWTLTGEVASKQSLIAAGFPSEEGPNENDVVTLKDGTILCVFRRDGGDGQPEHSHVPYVFATSTDLGATWKLASAPSMMLSARPRALVLPNGALAISGGRPALNLWISPSGDANGPWTKYDIPSVHNAHVTSPDDRYCAAFENATATLGWYQSSCYTQIEALSDDTGLVCYEKQGATSGGGHAVPPACAFSGSTIYCMRFTVTP